MKQKKGDRKPQNPQGRKEEIISGDEKKIFGYGVLAILVISFVVYLPILQNNFTNWDDNSYILNNILIRSINLKEIFSNNVVGNYHPLTVLIYAIEFHFFNLDPTGYYVVNLIIHLLNTLLVARVALLLSRKMIVALSTAILFGIHPIHVESVAWASELKDLLYTFFFLYSYTFYLKYLNEPKKKYYYRSLFLFLLSLLSKAMAVSLPVILLLTDYFKGRKIDRKVLTEKVPFLALSLLFGIVAFAAQRSFGSTDSTVFPLPQRIIFASFAFLAYMAKVFLPVKLCSYYPYPIVPGQAIPSIYFLYPAAVIILIGVLIYFIRKTRTVFFGIAFFATTVFLVLQILPVGDTIMADRYSYIPSIGIFFLVGEFIYFLWQKKFRIPVITIMVIIIPLLSLATYSRCHVWKDGMTLWNDVIRQQPDAAVAYSNRGYLLMNEKKLTEALFDFNKAIELKPDYAFAYNNRAVVLKSLNRIDEVMINLNKAIELKPDYVDALNNRGIVFTMQKKYPEAIVDFNKSLELKPNVSDVYSNRGIAEFNSGNVNDACEDFKKGARLGNQKADELFRNYCH